MSAIRTFVAVELPSDVRARAVDLAHRLEPAGAKVGWVKPDNLHLTLKFLGNVDDRLLAEVCQAVSEAVADIEPFAVVFGTAGAFPNPHRPRTIWLGVTEGEEEMVALNDAVERALAEVGFRRENRRYRPHLTIGRVREGNRGIEELAQLLEKNADFHAGEADVSEVLVFSSELTREGPEYGIIGRAELGG